jgi:hypothetical protein
MNKQKRGGKVIIPKDLLMKILADKLGLDPAKLQIYHVTTEHYCDGVAISLVGTDERFPILEQGDEIPEVLLTCKQHEDGSIELLKVDRY